MWLKGVTVITSCGNEGDECKRTADDASKMLDDIQGAAMPWDEHGGHLLTGHAVSGVKAALTSFGLSHGT